MFKVSSIATFWRDVKFTERVTKTEEQEFSFKLCFKRLPLEELQVRTSPETNTESMSEFLTDVVTDWDDVAGEDGQPSPFTADNFQALLAVPGISLHAFQLYIREVGALRVKN